MSAAEAHDIVYDAAQEAAVSDKTFIELLSADKRVIGHLSTGQIEKLLDPTAYAVCAKMA